MKKKKNRGEKREKKIREIIRISVGVVLWFINSCRLFNAKSCIYIYIYIYI